MNILSIIALSLPLAVVLLSLAIMPLLAPKFWHKNETTIFAIVCAISIICVYTMLPDANMIMKDALIDDYLPFIIMLFTLYILSHGIHIKLKCPSNTVANIIFLGCGSLLSSFIGTTGSAMLFLRPFLEMNKHRTHKTHLIIFFIFLIANIGGLLSPLGDPPLLLGYLHGVEFTWEMKNIFFCWLGYTSICLAVLYCVDRFVLKKETSKHHLEKWKISIKVGGWLNVCLVITTVFILFFDIDYDLMVHIPYSCDCTVPHICIKNVILLLFCGLSFYRMKKKKDKVDFEPFKEVAQTFFVIFIVIAPVLFMLNEGADEIHRYIVSLSGDSDVASVYFWLCSLTSSFLDNAPSYLLFFNMAGGNANELMYVFPNILKAISVSSVVMGAMTYIGNAPNMMVRSIAIKNDVKMPSFLGYMGWSCIIILPISFIMTLFMTR